MTYVDKAPNTYECNEIAYYKGQYFKWFLFEDISRPEHVTDVYENPIW